MHGVVVGVDFQADVLEAHRRGMRCVFLKEEEERQNDVPSSATPAEGTQKTYTAMGSETYLQDSFVRTSPAASFVLGVRFLML